MGAAGAELYRLTPRFNGAPGQDYPIIVRESGMPGGMFITARWGIIPRWSREANPQVKPINAMAEKIASSGLFRDAYRWRRALMPIGGFLSGGLRSRRSSRMRPPWAMPRRSASPRSGMKRPIQAAGRTHLFPQFF
jgi:putative SOS response-associated peptidase YedK